MKKTVNQPISIVLKVMITIVVFASICVIAVSLLYWFHFGSSIEADNALWGTFGDFFGGTLNPILSFLALITVLLTISLQKYELQLTNKEIEETNESSKIDSFERSFFEMLRLHIFIVNDLTLITQKNNHGFKVDDNQDELTIKGRSCFKYLRDELDSIYKLEIEDKTIKNNEYHEYCKKVYTSFAKKYEHKIGHYFRFLYRIFKHIDESSLDNSKKKHYSGITRALLSSNELALLFYDCFYKKGQKFARYIIDYKVFENMEYEKLLDRINHMMLFDKDAYGEDVIPDDTNFDVSTFFLKTTKTEGSGTVKGQREL
jgi:uncharacterized membrane protein